MRTRPLLVTALVVLTVSASHAWPPIAPQPAPAPTLDQLIDRLADVRAQETALQARRADLERQVRDRLAEQTRRLEQVGVSPAVPVVPGISSPTLRLHAVDVDAPVLPVARVRVAANVGFPPAPAREPVVSGSGEWSRDPVFVRDLQPSCPPSAGLDERLDALGGLPVAYNRWWRDTTPRRAPEPLIFFGSGMQLFEGN